MTPLPPLEFTTTGMNLDACWREAEVVVHRFFTANENSAVSIVPPGELVPLSAEVSDRVLSASGDVQAVTFEVSWRYCGVELRR